MAVVPTVEIEMGGKTVTLSPSLEAMIVVNDALGGYVGAFQAIANGNLSAIAVIVAAGSGMNRDKAKKLVYGTGVPSLLEPITEFTSILANGGKRKSDKAKDDEPGEQ